MTLHCTTNNAEPINIYSRPHSMRRALDMLRLSRQCSSSKSTLLKLSPSEVQFVSGRNSESASSVIGCEVADV